MDSISLDELIMTVRRQSQGFSRGSSAYRGVTRHPTGELITLSACIAYRLLAYTAAGGIEIRVV